MEITLTVKEWVKVIEKQINSSEANFSLVEKTAYLSMYFDSDSSIPKQAMDIVRSNLVRNM